MPISLDEKILTASMRAEFRLKQRLEQLEWEEETLKPQIERLRNEMEKPGNERIINVTFEGKGKRKTR